MRNEPTRTWTDRLTEGAVGLAVGGAYLLAIAALFGPMTHAIQHMA